MSLTLQQRNTRILLQWLPLVMIAGSVFLYFLMRGHILHMQEQQLHLKQNNIWRSFSANPESLTLHIPGEYDITPERGAAIRATDRPRDTILTFVGYPAERFNLLTTRFSDGEQSYLITAYISSKEVTHLIIKIAVADALIFLLLLVAVVVINRRISGRLWKPFYTTMDRLRRYDIRQKESITLLGNTGIEEFDRLNKTLVSLIDNAHNAFHNQKQFTENAAHELQTPVAIIRSKLELMSEGPALNEETAAFLGEIGEANERLSQMSRNLLLLTRIENRQFPDNETVDLSRLLAKQTSFFGDYYEDQVPATKWEIAPGVHLTANSSLLEILINNLLRNAFVHNIQGGYVYVSLTQTCLLVENSGAPIEGDPARLFERFRKGQEGSATNGLGLSLVYQICQLYQYDLHYGYHANVHQLRVTFPGNP
jgi:signal transduction histidine kinase